MKPGEIQIVMRAVVPVADIVAMEPHLETTEDAVWLSRTQRGLRCTWRGVPAKRVDLVVIDGYGLDGSSRASREEGRQSPVCIVEICRKSGRYDGAERDRITVRPYVRPYAVQARIQAGRLFVLAPEAPGNVAPTVRVRLDTCDANDGTPLRWEREYQRLRWAPDPAADPRAVVMWHATRYFPAALADDAAALASSWTWPTRDNGEPATLAEANRAADRALYRMARDAGWRKLTLRERRKLGWEEAPQWHRQDEILARLAELGHTATGTGDWSRDEATGGVAPAVEVTRRRFAAAEAEAEDAIDNV